MAPWPPPRGPVPLRGREATWVPAAHWLAIFTLWVGPLIVLLTVGEHDARVRAHALEALNHQVTFAFAMLLAALLVYVGVGVVGLLVLPLWTVLQHALAAIRSSNGHPYRYPLTLRIVR